MAMFGNSWKDDKDDDGPLMHRSWIDDDECPHDIPPLPLKQQLDQLTDSERLELFSNYCKHCGGKELPCYCSNDE